MSIPSVRVASLLVATLLVATLLAVVGEDEIEIPGKIHTLLPFDAIKAIKEPTFVSAEKAQIPDEARVIAVTLGDERRVYDPNLLNLHEIVNDEAAGKKFAVAW